MGMLTERITPAWVLQFYSGLKTIVYLCSLLVIPYEVAKGQALRHLPFNDVAETAWRAGFRLAALLFWGVLFLWAGGKLWPAKTPSPSTPPSS
jgi:hypothetical protein